MKSNKYKCEICGSDINPYNFFKTIDKKKLFCSKKCCKENYYETKESGYLHSSTCGGYYDCKKLNNVDGRCRTVNELHFSGYGVEPLDVFPNRCPPAEISIIRTNMKLYDFVKYSEEKSSKLNEETLNLSKTNVKLAKAMLVFTIVNVFCVGLQIYFQVFFGG